MHFRKVLMFVFAAAIALLGATTAQPTSGSGGVRVLRTATHVTGLAADGSLAAVSTAACGPSQYQLYAWNPVRRSVVSMVSRHLRECGHETIDDAGIAGARLAWVPSQGSNSTASWLVTATVWRPRPIARLTGERVQKNPLAGDWVGNVHGDGSLLVFNTWSVCEVDSCPEGIPSFHIYNENLWRIVGPRKRLLLASPDELTVLSVAAGRILAQRADGSLELRRGTDGSLLRAFRFRRGEVRAALLGASELVVLDHGSTLTWRVFDLISGEQKRVFAAPGRAIAADVERGLLVYTVGRVVHVLRLADGRQRVFVAPVVKGRDDVYRPSVFAQIEPSGLFYSYWVKREGRVRFVPFGEIRFR